MGGVDITHSVVNENSINITSVTGNIIITVTTVESYETVKNRKLKMLVDIIEIFQRNLRQIVQLL